MLSDFFEFDKELKVREDTAIQKLENYDQEGSLNSIFSVLKHPNLIYYQLAGENSAEESERLIVFLRDNQSYIESAHQHKSNILKILESFKSQRTGMVEIKIILLNLGDTDGLVKQDGRLYIGDRKESIYITEKKTRNDEYNFIDIPEKFQSIPKRSMVQKVFIIDVSATASGILNTFKEMVIKGDRNTRYRITLDDIRDAPIHSNPFYLLDSCDLLCQGQPVTLGPGQILGQGQGGV